MPLDPRTVVNARQGTPLRDAAVDPLPKDFLGPTNAGKAGDAGNPHGPHVVNPELHGIEAGSDDTGPGTMVPLSSVANLVEYHPTAATQP